jgi:hypothetical protein
LPNVTQAPVVFTPDARDDQNGSHFMGPFVVGANLYAITAGSNFTFLNIFKSTDNGVTWNRMDQTHAPRIAVGGVQTMFDPLLIGTVFSILYGNSSGGAPKIITFDTATDTYGAPSVDGPGSASMVRLAMFSNGDLLAVYLDTSVPGPSFSIYSGGAWGAEVSFIGNVSITGLVMGADDIARLFYYTHPAGVTVSMRTFTHAGVIGAQQAVFSSTYRANQESTFNEFPVGRIVIWNGNLILPYYGNPAGSGFQAGIYIGTPYTAPVWTFLLADTLVWAGTELDSYAYAFIDSGNNLVLFWCSVDTANNISQIYFAVNSGAGFGAPVLFYDETANPPVGAQFGPVVRTLSATLFANGKYGVISSSTTNCAGFYLIDGAAPPPPPIPAPTPVDYWNPGSAETLLCERNYPWIVPPKDAKPERLAASIPAPVANVVTELWNFQVPDGFWFVFDRLAFLATVAGYVDGSGSLFFILDVNSPIGNPSPMARPIAKFTRQVGELSEPQQVGPVQLYQGDTLRAKVLSVDGTLGVGLPNVIHGIVEGWIFPQSRNV